MPAKIRLPGPTVFNPLSSLSSSPGFKAEAAVQNMLVGICPKCKKPMGAGKVANGDTVHWCPTCCVASPTMDA